MGNVISGGRLLNGDDNDDAFENELLTGFDDKILHDQKYLQKVIRQSDDAPWILSSAFMILTMQSGFAMRKCSTNKEQKKNCV